MLLEGKYLGENNELFSKGMNYKVDVKDIGRGLIQVNKPGEKQMKIYTGIVLFFEDWDCMARNRVQPRRV